MSRIYKLLVLAVFCLVVLFSAVSASFGQKPEYDKHKYKKFWLVNTIGENHTGDPFFIGAGSIKISFSVSPKSEWAKAETMTLRSNTGDVLTLSCCMPKSSIGAYPGVLDSVQNPEFYKEGFSEQDDIITYKKGGECLHVNIRRRLCLKTLTIREFGLTDLIGKKPSDIRRDFPFAAVNRPQVGTSGNPITAEDTITIPMTTYEYRYWKDGKEVKYQPDINRTGSYGTYGDEEKPQVAIVGVSEYKDATVNMTEAQLFTAGGIDIAFKKATLPGKKGRVYFSAKYAQDSIFYFSKVGDKLFAEITDPSGYRYSPLQTGDIGFEIGLGEVTVIKAEAKNGKGVRFLAIGPTSFNEDKTLSCQLRFWADRTSGLLASTKP